MVHEAILSNVERQESMARFVDQQQRTSIEQLVRQFDISPATARRDLYALVERGCRLIVVCDCGADPELGFEDIGTAIRRCRIDFGAEIDLQIDPFVWRNKQSREGRTHVVEGRIIYQPDHWKMLCMPKGSSQIGRIVWIKPSVTAHDSADVRQYQKAERSFPQQSTADQWYDESQFESYRRLGYESALDAAPLI